MTLDPPQVLDWLRVIIDGHLPRLLMAKKLPAALHGLQQSLKSKVGALFATVRLVCVGGDLSCLDVI